MIAVIALLIILLIIAIALGSCFATAYVKKHLLLLETEAELAQARNDRFDLLDENEKLEEDNQYKHEMLESFMKDYEALDMHCRFVSVERDNAHRLLELAIANEDVQYDLIKNGLFK